MLLRMRDLYDGQFASLLNSSLFFISLKYPCVTSHKARLISSSFLTSSIQNMALIFWFHKRLILLVCLLQLTWWKIFGLLKQRERNSLNTSVLHKQCLPKNKGIHTYYSVRTNQIKSLTNYLFLRKAWLGISK